MSLWLSLRRLLEGDVTLTEGWTLRYTEVEGETVCGQWRAGAGSLSMSAVGPAGEPPRKP